jgi:8-oxo-dGTP diphosphatase
MANLRQWMVAGGIIESNGHILLVENLRRNGRTDWSTPGGVVELGEDPVSGLTREVGEETGLEVATWQGPIYRVSTTAGDMGWHMEVEVHRATSWTGEVATGNDPDGIVVQAKFCDEETVMNYLGDAAQWVREPMLSWVTEKWTETRQFRYEVRGADRSTAKVSRLL